MATQYVLQDRNSTSKYALKISEGQLFYDITTDDAQAEPILRDTLTGVYYKIYIADSELQYETTENQEANSILLEDISTSDIWVLQITGGVLNILPYEEQVVYGYATISGEGSLSINAIIDYNISVILTGFGFMVVVPELQYCWIKRVLNIQTNWERRILMCN